MRNAALTCQLSSSEESGIFSTDPDPTRTRVGIQVGKRRRSVQRVPGKGSISSRYAVSTLSLGNSVSRQLVARRRLARRER